MVKKRIISVIAVLLILILLLYLATLILMPKYMSVSKEGALISEYYTEADLGNTHQVIFVGDCEVYESCLPPVLWDEYGITT